eukprot:COSAG02_NODE_4754_length_5022_cov_2.228113_5_plen_89_part_00
MATDLIAVANALGVKRFAVGGQSYGTRVSLFAAAIAMGRIDKIVLVVPPPITSLWGTDGAGAQLHAHSSATMPSCSSVRHKVNYFGYL